MCAVFGAFNCKEAARITYFGLFALQHRGQESSGIVSSDGDSLKIHKGNGLVAQVFKEKDFLHLKGTLAIGHNRYATSGRSDGHTQPVHRKNSILAISHNGNLPSVKKIKQFLKEKSVDCSGLNDSELMYEGIRYFLLKGFELEDAIKECVPYFSGVYCLLVMTKNKIAAIRDACGIRPMVIGKLNGGFVISSETCALNTVGAQFMREIDPGEMVIFTKSGMRSYKVLPPTQKIDIFEFVYFARPDSVILGKSVNEVRRNFGRRLAVEYPVKADIIVPVPDSGIPASLGYSEVSGIPFDFGLIKNRYVHRTFIQPTQKLREKDVEMKLNPMKHVLKDKRVVVIDDSIVRGTTSKKIVSMIRKAGAKEVHLLISSPPVKYPDFYGINTPHQKDLIASTMTGSEITKFIGADSLYYLSYKGMIEATGLPEEVFCTSCFSGEYPIEIGERMKSIEFEINIERKSNHLPLPA